MITTRTTFSEIKLYAQKSFVCACGKKVRRSKTFIQTLNPFNKTKTGEVKTARQISAENQVAADAWRKVIDPCTHAVIKKCGAEFGLPSEDMNLDTVYCDLAPGHGGAHYKAPRMDS